MKKKLLFVIPSLDAGGAEKSLVNLLNSIDETQYLIDLFMFSQNGLFLSKVPDFVTILPKNAELEIFQKSLLSSILDFSKNGKFSLIKNRILFFFKYRNFANKNLAEQYSWKYIQKSICSLEENYDVAIGFLEKSSIYFVVDKVSAKKKIGFIHTLYSKLNLNLDIEKKYLNNLDKIASVSNECSNDLKEIFPKFSDKINIVHNIVSSKLIKNSANEVVETLSKNSIISIGRLVKLKGFDLAIEAAHILKKRKIDFHWFIIGEGNERQNLENLINKFELQENVKLLGLKKNPYPYIKNAKVFVQPSRYEGKSIAIDEAKILAKPIILTNFTTAKDQIEHNKNGLICEMNPVAIAEAIIKYFENQKFTEKIIANLLSENFGTESEIENFYKLINE